MCTTKRTLCRQPVLQMEALRLKAASRPGMLLENDALVSLLHSDVTWQQ
jgi:hypothetical protein